MCLHLSITQKKTETTQVSNFQLTYVGPNDINKGLQISVYIYILKIAFKNVDHQNLGLKFQITNLPFLKLKNLN
jgi:hypothetical protein